MIDRFEKFTLLISDINKYFIKIAQDQLKNYGLRASHALYLTSIYKNKNGVTASQLSTLLGRDKADVSRMLAILIEKNLVSKESDNKNHYGGLIFLTEEGLKVAEEIIKKAEGFVENISRDIKSTDREIMYNSLEIISENLKEISK